MNILSIQSHVAYGHVGNASAVFPMQRLGVEVWPIHTVQFSNHTGYGAWKGRVFDGPAIEELVDGIAERGVLPRCDGVLSGYMGSADIGNAILSAVERVREANPEALYCCDPVIGDVGRGVFVRPGIPEFMREQAVPAADIITPNQFELDFLSGIAAGTLADAQGGGRRRAIASARRSCSSPRSRPARRRLTPSTSSRRRAAGFWRVRTPRLSLSVNGAGDAIAALFFVHYARSRSAATALGRGRRLDLRAAQADRGGGLARDPHGRRAGRVRGADTPVRGREALKRRRFDG